MHLQCHRLNQFIIQDIEAKFWVRKTHIQFDTLLGAVRAQLDGVKLSDLVYIEKGKHITKSRYG